MSKKLLSERQVRRFQALAEISAIKENEPVEETIEETEELEEGGLAYRSENIPQDAGKGRLQPDRIREEEEVSEGEETVEEGGPAGHYTGPKAVEVSEATEDPATKQAAPNGVAPETAAATVTSPADDPAPPSPAQKMAHHVGDKDISTKDFKSAARGEVKKQRAKTRDTKRAATVAGKAHKYTTKLDAMKEGVDGLDEAQMRDLIQRVQKRIVQESRQVRRLANREKKVQALEAQMAHKIEAQRAAQNREALIENLVSRVADRLRNLKDQ